MPTITRAPSPEQFARAFKTEFEKAVKEVAGQDGRLSRAEARRIAGPYADNALNYLERTGQQSVSVQKLVGAAERYAFVQAQKAAGPDGRVSLADGGKLSGDLRLDFFKLRGKEVGDRGTTTVEARRNAYEANFDPEMSSWTMPADWLVANLREAGIPAALRGTDAEKLIADELKEFEGVITSDNLNLYKNPADGTWGVLYEQDGELFGKLWLFDEQGRQVAAAKSYDDGTLAWLDR